MTPHQLNPIDDKILHEKEEFEPRSGREIYDELSKSGLNRLPIHTLMDFILSGVDIRSSGKAAEEIDVEVVTENILVDGSMARYEGQEGKDKWLKGLVIVEEALILQQMEGFDDLTKEAVTRRWQRKGKTWLVEDFIKYGTDDQERIGKQAIPGKFVFVYVNGRGILYPVQRTYDRLEQIIYSLEGQTSGSASVSNIITGYAGGIGAIRAAFEAGSTLVSVPGEVQLLRLVSTEMTDQLIAQFETMFPIYMRSLRVVDIDDSSTISGISRRLTMMPMLTYVNKTREKIVKIMDIFKVTVEFPRIQVETADELEGQLRLYDRLLEKGVITREEYKRKAMRLIG